MIKRIILIIIIRIIIIIIIIICFSTEYRPNTNINYAISFTVLMPEAVH